MITIRRFLLSLCFTCLIPCIAFAEAPVVDESENFAILDEQAAIEQPIAKAQLDQNNDEEVALAKDTGLESGDNASLTDKIQGLQQEIQELRGQLDNQTRDLKNLQQQQLAFYKDLDDRLRNINSTKSVAMAPTELNINSKTPTPSAAVAEQKPLSSAVSALSSTARLNPAEEQISYLAAYDLVKTKHFDEALAAMQNFVNRYPQGGYTANAQYWLGELHIIKRNYPKAIDHFEVVLKQFPSSSKAAASSLKIGYALAASGREKEARQRLEQVLRKYPDTPTAELAKAKLESLNAT